MKIERSTVKLIGLAFLCMLGGLFVGSRLGAVKQDVAKFHRYDVNQDGNVTQQDVLIIINHLNNQRNKE